MDRRLFAPLAAAVLAAFGIAAAETPVSVLMIGNSYTDGTDDYLPGFFNAASGYSLTLKTYVPGGYQLREHLANATVIADIQTGRYDVVMLQEQSQTPSYAYRDYVQSGSANSFPVYAQQRVDANGIDPIAGANYFSELLENFWGGACGLSACIATSSTSRIVYFAHWARHTNDTSFLPYFPGSSGAARAANMLAYGDHAFEGVQQKFSNRSEIARIGDAWALAYKLRPTIMLHNADLSHGSVQGYYLAAAVLFETVTRHSSISNTYTAGLSADEALFLQSVATRTTGMQGIQQMTSQSNWLSLQFHGISPLRYTVEMAPTPSGAWSNVAGTVTGADTAISLSLSAPTNATGFFRVRIAP